MLPYPVTGGSVGDGEGRLDFDCEALLDKAEVERKLNELIALDAPVTQRWITDEELEASPALVKTMSVKPPTGTGRVRLVAIENLDLQPCGGTHVARTGEIGRASVHGEAHPKPRPFTSGLPSAIHLVRPPRRIRTSSTP